MDLERLSVRLRPRKPWEAVDLGFAMVRNWRGAVYGPWLTLTVPAVLALVWTLHFWGLVIFWWFLPLFEAVVLFPLSRAVFGEEPSARETLRAAPVEMRRAWREALFRRLHPARSFALPIGQLEGLKGKERATRRSVLSRAIDVHGSMTVVFVCFQCLLLLALFSLLVAMTPGWMGIDWGLASDRFFDGTSPTWAYDLAWTITALVMIAIDPFYVASGFALYLDRRTALEGWDLEIAFRRMARRLDKLETDRAESASSRRAGSGGKSGGIGSGRAASWIGFLTVGLLAGGVILGAGPTRAQQADVDASTDSEEREADGSEVNGGEADGSQAQEPPRGVWNGPEDEDPRALAREITSRPEFGGMETTTRWRLREDLTNWFDDDKPKPASKPNPILLAVVWFLVQLSRLSLWLVVAVVLIGLVILAIRKWPESKGKRPKSAAAVPETLFGLDLRAESLPADIPGEAESLWRRGDAAGALSLLYRGALKRLADEGVTLAESFTEDDCLRAARGSLEPMRTGFFAELTRAWQRVAYGHRLPESAEGERWCGGWRRHFGASP